MVPIEKRIRFQVSADGKVIKLTPVPGQQLPGYGGQVGGEITLTNLEPQAYDSWRTHQEAFAEVQLPTPA